MRLLIAEDDLLSRALLAGVLKKSGHEVVETTDGLEAWDILQQPGAPELAILDWMMPGMDGLEVVRRVRALPTGRPPYLIMLTGKAEKADLVAALEAGANDYLAKPFDHGELRTRVQVGRQTVEMQSALAAMNDDLRAQHIEMEMQIEELRRTQAKLDASRARYFDLSNLRQRIAMVEQEERCRIAHSLHECTVQDLVAIQLNLNRASQMLGEGDRAVREILGECSALAEDNANELRSLAYDLHAPWLQHGGLRSGIQAYAHQFSSSSGLAVTFEAPPTIPRLQQSEELALYRVMQDCLRKVSLASGAKSVWILLSIFDGILNMTIRDDRGAQSPSSLGDESSLAGAASGTGNISAHERMGAVGGFLDTCRSNEGVSVRARLPLSEENQIARQPLCAS